MKRLIHRFFALLAVTFVVAGCASIGQQKPVTPEDDLRYAQATLSGIYKTISSSLASGALTGPQARSIYTKAEPVATTLASVDGVCRTTPNCTLPTTLQSQIAAALLILTDIANQLRASLPPAQTTQLVAPR